MDANTDKRTKPAYRPVPTQSSLPADDQSSKSHYENPADEKAFVPLVAHKRHGSSYNYYLSIGYQE